MLIQIFYHLFLFANDLLIIIIIDNRTSYFLRISIIFITIITITIALITFLLFIRLNHYSHRMIPIVQSIIYNDDNYNCNSHHYKNDDNNIHLSICKFKAQEILQQFQTNMIGVYCGNLFTFTNR